MNAYRSWLENHLKEATAEFKKLQADEEQVLNDRDLYERVHQMWGYLAGLEKCLKEFDTFTKAKPAATKAAAAKKTSRKK